MNKQQVMIIVVILLLVFVHGCSSATDVGAPTEEPVAAVMATGVVKPTEMAPTDVPTEVPVEEVTAPAPQPTDVPESEIENLDVPGQAEGKKQTILDQVSRDTAMKKQAFGGDDYYKGRYERPFMAEWMRYLPFIDIVQTDLVRDEAGGWIYVNIEVVDSPATSGDQKAIYGVEVDNDLDGRGDVLILAAAPESSEWTTEGVQIWLDVNESVGGMDPMRSNAPAQVDGYEFKVFDGGEGDDLDLAWVRISPDAVNEIEIAFKLDVVSIGEDYYFFLWGAWAFVDDAHPEWFDHHDYFYVAEAGSPMKDNIDYPLKQFFGADNTCRALSGWSSPSLLPGMCPLGSEEEEDVCYPVNCCENWPSTSTCPLIWNPDTCSCVNQ